MNLDFLADQIFSSHPRSDLFDGKDRRFEIGDEELCPECGSVLRHLPETKVGQRGRKSSIHLCGLCAEEE